MAPSTTSKASQGPELTIAQVALALGIPARTARRRVAAWQARQWPRVRVVACRGDRRGRYLVDAASFDRFCLGEVPEMNGTDGEASTQGEPPTQAFCA